MSFLKTLLTVNVTSDAKKAVGIHEIKKKSYVYIRIMQHQYYSFLYFSLKVFLVWFFFIK